MRAEDRKPSKRVFPLLQNLDLDSVTFSQVQSVGEPISIEDMNEQEMVDLIIVNLARLCVESEWTGLLEAGGGSDAPINVQIYPTETTGDNSFIPIAPIQQSWTSTATLTSLYNTPSHYPFYSGDYTEIEELAIFFGGAGDAGSTGSLAIYTLSTSDDAGWDVGRPMAMVANSEVSYATDTSSRVEVSPASTVTLTPKTWYTLAIVGDQGYTSYPEIYRTSKYALFWMDQNYGGLKADGETNYTLPASYTTSTVWATAQTLYDLPNIAWRGAN